MPIAGNFHKAKQSLSRKLRILATLGGKKALPPIRRSRGQERLTGGKRTNKGWSAARHGSVTISKASPALSQLTKPFLSEHSNSSGDSAGWARGER